MSVPVELKLGEKTQALAEGCCVVCTPGCCGIGAYNFSLLQIASYVYMDPNAEVLESDFEIYRTELRVLLESGERLEPDEDGLVCSISGMNQYFSHESLRAFVTRLQRNLDLAPKVMLYSLKLERGEQAGTGQPATRPESKSEGGDKPQPEAEGRSR